MIILSHISECEILEFQGKPGNDIYASCGGFYYLTSKVINDKPVWSNSDKSRHIAFDNGFGDEKWGCFANDLKGKSNF